MKLAALLAALLCLTASPARCDLIGDSIMGLVHTIDPPSHEQQDWDLANFRFHQVVPQLAYSIKQAKLDKAVRDRLNGRLNDIAKASHCQLGDKGQWDCPHSTPVQLDSGRALAEQLAKDAQVEFRNAGELTAKRTEVAADAASLLYQLDRVPLRKAVKETLTAAAGRALSGAPCQAKSDAQGVDCSNASLDSLKAAQAAIALTRGNMDAALNEALKNAQTAKQFSADAAALQGSIQHSPLERDAQTRLLRQTQQAFEASLCVSAPKLDCREATAESLKAAQASIDQTRKEMGAEAMEANKVSKAAQQFAADAAALQASILHGPIGPDDRSRLLKQVSSALETAKCVPGSPADCSKATAEALKAAQAALDQTRAAMGAAGSQSQTAAKDASQFAADAAALPASILHAPIGQDDRSRLLRQVSSALETAKCVPGSPADCSKATAESLKSAQAALDRVRSNLGAAVNQARDLAQTAQGFAADAAQLQTSILHAPIAHDAQGRLMRQAGAAIETAKCVPGSPADCSKATAESLKAAQDAVAEVRKVLNDEVNKGQATRQLAKGFANDAAELRKNMLDHLKTEQTKKDLLKKLQDLLSQTGCSEKSAGLDCSQASAAQLTAGRKSLDLLKADIAQAINAEKTP